MELIGWNFNYFYSLPFWLAFLLIVPAIRLFSSSPLIRGVGLALSSSLFLLAIPRFGLVDLGLLLGLSGLTYGLGWALNRTPRAGSARWGKPTVLAGILAVLGFLAFFKYPFIQDLFARSSPGSGIGSTGIIRMVGVSYFSFRMIHFLVESYRKKIEGLSPLTYLNYVIFFPSFISGPINRYNHFSSQFRPGAGRPFKKDLAAGAERIVHGLFKKLVLAQVLQPYILPTQPDLLARLQVHEAVLGLYAYAFYFYFDFAGYSDLAIGCGRVLGFELPENFNVPFLKRNIRELWANWHMSLTSWLVDYIYWPIVRKFRSLEVFRKHPILLSNVGMIITFISCGMWHGEAANFILWGAYHGLGISVLTVYQRKKKAIPSPIAGRYFRSRLSTVLGIFLTFNFFALGLVFFVLDIGKLQVLLTNFLSRV